MKSAALSLVTVLALSTGLSFVPASAQTTILYQTDSDQYPDVYESPSYTPTAPALAFTDVNLFGAAATRDSVTNVDSTASNSAYAIYSNNSISLGLSGATLTPVDNQFPTLDATEGYSINFGMDLLSEDHTGDGDRGGYSLVVIDNNLQGIELGFHDDNIFAQNDGSDGTTLFTAGESVDGLDLASAGMVNYTLTVLGDGYTLSGDGVSLTGTLRNYSSFTGFGYQVYQTPDFLAFGDDTTAAGASFDLGDISLVVAPEPSEWALMLVGLGVLFLYRTRRNVF